MATSKDRCYLCSSEVTHVATKRDPKTKAVLIVQRCCDAHAKPLRRTKGYTVVALTLTATVLNEMRYKW